MKEHNTMFYHLATILIVIAWGVSFVSTRVLLDSGLTPTQIYIYRFILSYLLVAIASHSKLFANNWRDEALFLVCGMCGNSIYYLAENTALEYTLTSNVSLITTLSPLLTLLLLGSLYKSERPGFGMILGSIVAFLGVGCVIFNSSVVLQVNPFGDLLALGAALSFAIYSVVVRKLNAQYPVLFISRKTFFYGVLTGLPFLLVQTDGAPFSVLTELPVYGNLLFLGVICSMIAFIVLAESIKRIGTITTSNYLYLQPIVTLVASAVILSEHVTIVGYVGCALILLGVWLSDFLTRRQKTKV